MRVSINYNTIKRYVMSDTTSKNSNSSKKIVALIAAAVLTLSMLSSSMGHLAFAAKDKDKDHQTKDNDKGKDHQTDSESSDIKLEALPKQSLIDDGNSQLLKLQFKLDTGNSLKIIRVTIDKTTNYPKVIEFDGSGKILSKDPAFQLVYGSTTMLSDGYAVGPAKGKFVIAMDKTAFSEGNHQALAEVVLDTGTLSAQDQFTLQSVKQFLPDLVANHFFAPTKIIEPKAAAKFDIDYMTFTIESNDGGSKATEHNVQVYLSNDSTLSLDDKMIGNTNVKCLNAGDFDLMPVKIDLPKNTATGQHYLIVKVDATDKIKEQSEDNNILSAQTKVIPL